MFTKIRSLIAPLIGFGILGFLIYVQAQPADFKYERSGVIQASPETIYPYLSQFKLGNLWSPYLQKDPKMKSSISGTDGTVGAPMEFAGNTEVGKGRLDMLTLVPNERVVLKLTMIEPIQGENTVIYTLKPEALGKTRFTWTMTGTGGFISKLLGVLNDCDKLVAADFEKGIATLKALIELKK
jgi:uncharacterized protein YndB with AHSA1/START domain